MGPRAPRIVALENDDWIIADALQAKTRVPVVRVVGDDRCLKLKCLIHDIEYMGAGGINASWYDNILHV